MTRWDEAVLNGWGVRPNDDEILIGVQHQLSERLMADVQWNYHRFGKFLATEFRATPPEVYDSFCVTAPTDPRLPGGGGNQICGFMDIQRAYFGLRPDNVVTSAANFGNVEDVFTGLDATLTARLPNGGVASGGFSTGRERTDFCDVAPKASIGSNAATTAGRVGESTVSAYPSALYCSVTPPYQADWKALVSYPLPWGMNASATWQNRPGPQVLANYVATTSETTLGRPLTQGTTTVNFIAPGTQYGDRLNQVDVRLGKNVQLPGRAHPADAQRVQPAQLERHPDVEHPLRTELAAADVNPAGTADEDRRAADFLTRQRVSAFRRTCQVRLKPDTT